mmetsp:Transcript_50564/g.134549  ORF Transcript_50564/g.134549 Transcript_50564/m.134549 type:complete len:285 (+) Transcript_50564:79-933(+)
MKQTLIPQTLATAQEMEHPSQTGGRLNLTVPSFQQARLHASDAPILAAVVTLAIESRARLRLVLIQDGEDTINHWHFVVQIQPHDRLSDSFVNILEMHALALHETADTDDSIVTPSLQEDLHSGRQLVGTSDMFNNDVLDIARCHGGSCTVDQGTTNHRVPPSADDGDPQASPVQSGKVQATYAVHAVGVRSVPLRREATQVICMPVCNELLHCDCQDAVPSPKFHCILPSQHVAIVMGQLGETCHMDTPTQTTKVECCFCVSRSFQNSTRTRGDGKYVARLGE